MIIYRGFSETLTGSLFSDSVHRKQSIFFCLLVVRLKNSMRLFLPLIIRCNNNKIALIAQRFCFVESGRKKYHHFDSIGWWRRESDHVWVVKKKLFMAHLTCFFPLYFPQYIHWLARHRQEILLIHLEGFWRVHRFCFVKKNAILVWLYLHRQQQCKLSHKRTIISFYLYFKMLSWGLQVPRALLLC